MFVALLLLTTALARAQTPSAPSAPAGLDQALQGEGPQTPPDVIAAKLAAQLLATARNPDAAFLVVPLDEQGKPQTQSAVVGERPGHWKPGATTYIHLYGTGGGLLNGLRGQLAVDGKRWGYGVNAEIGIVRWADLPETSIPLVGKDGI